MSHIQYRSIQHNFISNMSIHSWITTVTAFSNNEIRYVKTSECIPVDKDVSISAIYLSVVKEVSKIFLPVDKEAWSWFYDAF